MRKTNLFVIIVIGISLLTLTNASAQQHVENSMSQYFRNRMLWNPAFTAADGNKIYALQNRSWVGFDGAPVMTNISGELNFGKNSAVGLQIMSDVTGLLQRTFGVVNYAYKIKLNQEQHLRIGISLAFEGDRLNSKYIDQGGAIDPLIMNSVNRNLQFDGNIGAVYINNKLTVGLSFLRLKEIFSSKNGGNANLALPQLGASYDIHINNDEKLSLKPMVMLRLYKTTNTVVDLGGQFEYNKTVNAMLVYQTTGNIRAGAGIRMNQLGEANFFYNTNIKVPNASSQQYELGIGFYLKGKK